MDPTRYFASQILTQDIDRKPKNGNSFSDMTLGQISLFKLSTSTGNDLEHPVRPNERFSGVLVVQLTRPLHASQVVLEFTATERRLAALKDNTRFVKTPMFSVDLVLWRPTNKGPNPSSVLADGIHVFNFTCQMPHLNYPQSIQRVEYDFSYMLRGKVLVPLDREGDRVAAIVEKEVHFAPIVTQTLNADPLNIVETLCFEKKGKKGKPAVELRAAITGHQVIPGSKVRIDMSIKELSSTSWTKVVARLFERTSCRESTKGAFSQPLWSTDRELASTELVRSSVYNFFINDEVIGKNNTETTTSAGETITSEVLNFTVPLMPCSPLGSDHLEFMHYIRLDVILPNWLSSDRSVYTEFPVQLMTCDPRGAVRLLNRQTSLINLERNYTDGGDSISVSSTQNTLNRPQSPPSLHKSPSMALESNQAIVNSLPPTYYEVHPVQRPLPVLSLLKQVNATSPVEAAQDSSSTQRLSKLSRSTRHTTMSSFHRSEHSIDGRSVVSSQGTGDDIGEEKYRARPLPSAPAAPLTPPPPPLPSMPMPGPMPNVPPPLPTAPMPGSMPISPPPLPSSPMPSSAPAYSSASVLPSRLPGSAAPPSTASTNYQPHILQRQGSGGPAHALNGAPLMMSPYMPNATDQTSYDPIAAQYSAPLNGSYQGYTLNAPAPTDMSPPTSASSLPPPMPPTVLSRGLSMPNPSRPKQRPHTTMPQARSKSPISPAPNDPLVDDQSSDDDAGYFKASTAKRSMERERPSEKSIFRLRKNSSIKHSR
ncbi:hypothetical protein GQ54DRAFT_304012 [Martensiomyces pterosporus]|nr:hypothetical protein GQ54DRAFT_304012 [Martensiomyces pterosporus]